MGWEAGCDCRTSEMAGSVISDIYTAFQSTLYTWSLTQTPVPTISDENNNFEPTGNVLYLDTMMLWIPTHQATLGDTGYDLSRGIYQVSIKSPPNMGRSLAMQMANQLKTLFLRGSTLAYGATGDIRLQSVSVAPGVGEQDWYRVPVSVRWFAMTPNV